MHVLTVSVRGWPPVPDAKCSHVGERRAASGSPCDAATAALKPSSCCLLDLQALARRFTAAQRLHNKSDFDRVYRNAKRSADAWFAVFARPNGGTKPRLGLSIAARIVGNAVRRNRIKRLIRESFRHYQHDLPAVDIVVNARSAARSADNVSIARSLERHWRNVSKQCATS